MLIQTSFNETIDILAQHTYVCIYQLLCAYLSDTLCYLYI